MWNSRVVLAAACVAMPVWAQTTFNGSALTLRSTGTVSGATVQLQQNGYVGTYIRLTAPGVVNLSVNATGQAAGGVAPRMNIVVNDTKSAFDVGATAANYSTTLSLPAGTHFIRTEFQNDTTAVDRRLTVSSLTVTGATVSNTNSTTNALAAADTYVANYRRGPGRVAIPGAIPGTLVSLQHKRHAFRFGSIVPGTSTSNVNGFVGANPAPGSTSAIFQEKFLQHFNGVSPENAGKWSSNEATQNVVTMGGVDSILNFADRNDLRVRMHNLVWGSQQPNYINTLLTNAQAGDAAAAASLKNEVTQRVGYYVTSRAARYEQVDVYNESIHTPQYFNILGTQGVADLYNEVNAAAGGSVGLFTNEYNVLSDSTDSYANWYRSHVESIRDAGGAVNGIGIQYYAYNQLGGGNSLHSASRIHAALNNLAVPGMPLEITEFGVKDNGVGTAAENQATAAEVLRQSMRLAFGNPAVTGFTLWGFWASQVWTGAPAGVLYNADWSLTPAGLAYIDLMSADGDAEANDDWTTNVTLPVAADRTVDFTGFYGDYDLTVSGKTYGLSLAKGTINYSQLPPSWQLAAGGAWETGGNWRDGTPGGIGQTANFLTQLGAPATVSLASAKTVGHLAFNSTLGYTLAGAGITLNNGIDLATISVGEGSHVIGSALAVLSPLSVNTVGIDSQVSVLLPVQTNFSVSKTGPGRLELAGLRAASLTINGGVVRLTGEGTSVVGVLALAGGVLDLGGGDLVVDYAGASPLAVLIAAYQAGKILGQSDDGSGLATYVALAEAADLGMTEFNGVAVDATAVLAKWTYVGDANLDGQVDALDYERIDLAIGNSGVLGVAQGDLNYDGQVDALDYEQVDLNIGNGVGSPLAGVVVPEPGCVGLLAGGALAMRRRNGKKLWSNSRDCV